MLSDKPENAGRRAFIAGRQIGKQRYTGLLRDYITQVTAERRDFNEVERAMIAEGRRDEAKLHWHKRRGTK